MKKILFTCLATQWLIVSCSSSPKQPLTPPNYERSTLIKLEAQKTNSRFKPLSEHEEVFFNYIKSKSALTRGDLEQACDGFDDLRELDRFPLKSLSELRFQYHCSKKLPEIVNENPSKVLPNYHKNLSYKFYFELAKKFNSAEGQINYGLQYLESLSSKRDKILLLQELRAVARNNLVSAIQLEQIQKNLEELSPRFSTNIDNENRFKVAKDFESNREFDIARNMYLDIINSEAELKEKIKAYNAYRTSFKVERNLSMFLEKTGEMELYLRQLLELNPKDRELQEAWVDSKINFARAIWTEHQNEEARLILDDVISSSFGSSFQKAQVFWVYGLLHLESQENKNAIKKFESALKQSPISVEQEENILWSLIWTFYKQGDYEKQIELSEKAIARMNNHNFKYKLQFWLAKALLKEEKTERANAIFLDLTREDEFGFYGLMAHSEISLPLKPLNEKPLTLKPSGDLVLDWLLATDEKELAQSEIRQHQKKLKSSEDKKNFLPFYYFSEWFTGGMNLLLSFNQSERNAILKEFLPVFYPVLFKNEYISATKKFKTPLAYPLAISRQESNFNPTARSWADAFGLMQLIPEKASELSAKHQIPYKVIDDLYNPEINIQLGVALLSDLRKKYKGKFIQATASYNASDSAISTWEKERFNGDYLEFIENIPYEETRNYVKLVFRNYITYKRVLSDSEFIIEKDFFEKPFN